MSESTTNLNLTKPDEYELYDIGVFNANADKIDTFAGQTATALAGKADSSSLATVATSGKYTDLTNTPSLAAVATSGAYSDLSGTPDLTKLMTLGLGTEVTKCLDPDDVGATVEKFWLKTLTTPGVYYIPNGISATTAGDFPSNWDCIAAVIIVSNTTGATGSNRRLQQFLLPAANKSGAMVGHIYRRYETSTGFPKDSSTPPVPLWIDFAGTVV